MKNPRPECTKRSHGDLFGDIFDFGMMFAEKHVVFVFHRHRCGWPPVANLGLGFEELGFGYWRIRVWDFAN